MKRAVYTLIFSAFSVCWLFSQTSHTVIANGITFTPHNLTITAGDTVIWENQGGTHNVNGNQTVYPGNPESFLSGAPAAAPWTYTFVFQTPGNYDYQCDVHVGLGMTGTLTVLPTSGAESDIVISELMYNNPGDDIYEFIELYNRGNTPVDMTGWAFVQGVSFTFPALTLFPTEFVLVAADSVAFQTAFGEMAFQYTGALNNGGETVRLVDALGTLMDEVAYDDGGGWPTEPDGSGPSLVLCNYDADNNDPANWAAAITPTGFDINGVPVFANPGEHSQCPTGPVITFIGSGFTVNEDAGNVFLTIALSNGNSNPTEVSLSINPTSSATPGDDFLFLPPAAVGFTPGATNDTVAFIIPIVDDDDIESLESIVVDLVNPTNGATISPVGTFTVNIVDNDTPLSGALVISGIFDTQPSGAGVKGWELKAIKDIPDLSIFGVGSANNGGGSDGIEALLPPIPLDSGQCLYVATSSDLFLEFFGFLADLVTDAAQINGDDAVELFENNAVVDVFGDINTDGTGEPWEYTDGWAYRKSGTGPDGNIFELDNWVFSGINALDDVPNNASAPLPFPTCAYSPVLPDQPVANDDNANTNANESVTVQVLLNDVLPHALTSLTVVTQPANGTATPNGLDNITYTPDPGFCGQDTFSYQLCDAAGCDEAMVFVNVACPPNYPAANIATVTTVNPSGVPDSLGRTFQLQGIVYGVDLQGGTSIQFVLADATGGISLFSNNDFGYTVAEGDELIVQGTIAQFNCLTQITPDTLWMVSAGNALKAPALTTVLDESMESELLRIDNLTLVDPAQWTGTGSGFNVEVTNGSSTFEMRIDNDVDLYNLPAPTGTFHAIGLGSQFDNDGTCDGGYQFLPRYQQDIIPTTPTKEKTLDGRIEVFPNPAADWLIVRSSIVLERIALYNTLGQPLLQFDGSSEQLYLGNLPSGTYFVRFFANEVSWTARIAKR